MAIPDLIVAVMTQDLPNNLFKVSIILLPRKGVDFVSLMQSLTERVPHFFTSGRKKPSTQIETVRTDPTGCWAELSLSAIGAKYRTKWLCELAVKTMGNFFGWYGNVN